MFFVTLLVLLSIRTHNPYNWLIAGPLAFALVTSVRAPSSPRVRLAILILNVLILVASLGLNAVMFLREGFAPTIKN